MSAPPWLVVPAEGAQPVPSTPQAVHQAVATSQLPPGAPVSVDGGRSWMPAMRALEWHRTASAEMSLLVPTRVEPNSVIAGYSGLFSTLFFGGPIAFLVAIMGWDPGPKAHVKLAIAAVGALLGPLPILWVARKGRIALAADPSMNGMGRVWTGYVAAALMALGILAGLVGIVARALGV